VRGHFLRVLERAAVGEIGGDPGGAKRVATDFPRDAGRRGAAADHAPGIGLVHGEFGQRIGFVPARGAEQRALAVLDRRNLLYVALLLSGKAAVTRAAIC
jgi:hypothetical protein